VLAELGEIGVGAAIPNQLDPRSRLRRDGLAGADRVAQPADHGEVLDVAVRDVEMAIAAYTLARLTEAREAAVEPRTRGSKGKPVLPGNDRFAHQR
jgi:hypothetical protein